MTIRYRFAWLLLLCLIGPAARADAPAAPAALSAAETRAAFQKIIDRPRVALAAKEEPAPANDANAGVAVFNFS